MADGKPWEKYQAAATSPPAESSGEPSGLDSLWASLKSFGAGAAQTALGTGQAALGRRGAQPAARSPGETMAQQWLGTKAGAVEQAYQQDPSVQRNPNIAGVSKFAGEVAPTMMMGGGMPAMKAAQSGLSRLAGGALGGAAGAMATPTPAVDYYGEKLKQLAPAAGVGAAIPGVGGVLSQRLPSMDRFKPSSFIQGLPSATMQKIATSFRPLYDFVRGAEERTNEGFARTVAREAMAPIGGKIEGRTSGADLFQTMREQFSKAYDYVLPNINMTGGGPISHFISTMKPDDQRFFRALNLNSENDIERMWNAYVVDRFNSAGGVIDGQTFKQIQSDIGEYAWRKTGSKNEQADETGHAALRILGHFNDVLEQQNPAYGPALNKINSGYRVYALMRAAAGGPTSEFKFSPGNLLGTLNRASTDEQWVSAKDTLRLYSDAARNRMMQPLSGGIWPHLLTRHGLPMELMRGTAGPLGRALKTTASATAPAAGREAEPIVSTIGP